MVTLQDVIAISQPVLVSVSQQLTVSAQQAATQVL